MLTGRNIAFREIDGLWRPSIQQVEVALGQTLGILGGCNSGKTRIALALAGLNPRNTRGHVAVFERPVESLTDLERACLIGFVPSDPHLLFAGVRKHLRGEFDIGRQFLGDSSPEGEAQAERAVKLFDLNRLLDRDPFTLSGGEAARAAIALVMAKAPKIIILDQVFDALDEYWCNEVRKQLRAVLSDAVIVETHARLPKWDHKFDQLLCLDSSNRTEPIAQAEDVAEAETAEPSTVKSAAGSRIALECSTGAWALKVSQLQFAYRTSGFHLGPIDLVVHRGEAVALVGPNGSGKTTLLKCIALLNEPKSGLIEVQGPEGLRRRPPPRKRLHEWARSAMYVFQRPDDQLYLPSVRNEIEKTALCTGRLNVSARCEHVSMHLKLTNVLDASPIELPRPIRRLVTVAAALAAAPPLLLLDEPTVFLDAYQIRLLVQALRSYLSAGGAIALISHDQEFVQQIADRTCGIDQLAT